MKKLGQGVLFTEIRIFFRSLSHQAQNGALMIPQETKRDRRRPNVWQHETRWGND